MLIGLKLKLFELANNPMLLIGILSIPILIAFLSDLGAVFVIVAFVVGIIFTIIANKNPPENETEEERLIRIIKERAYSEGYSDGRMHH